MVIGVSGKKQTGKNTVADLIQYCIAENKYPNDIFTLDEFVKGQRVIQFDPKSHQNFDRRNISIASISHFEQHAYADKVKQIAAIILGVDVSKFEDEEFKSTPLGEEWRVWYCYNHGMPNDGIVSRYCYNEEEAEIQKDNIFDTFKMVSVVRSKLITPREILQIVGTDMGRNLIHPNIWINATFADYDKIYHFRWAKKFDEQMCLAEGSSTLCGKPMLGNNYAIQDSEVICPECLKNAERPDWIITDCRFPNEVKAIEDRGGFVIRVERNIQLNPIGDGKGLQYHISKEAEYNKHPSETSLDDYNFKYTIDNNGTIEKLYQNVKDVLIKERVI